MSLNRIIYSKVLVLLAIWWGWTVLIDFFVIPNVFRTLSNFFEAGDLGVIVFSKLNNLELILATILVAIVAYLCSKNKKLLPLLLGSVLLWIIAMTYFSFLSPKITELTALWKKADAAGSMAIAGYADIQQEHQFYHKLYIGIDTVKLLLITALLGLGILKQEKWV